MKVAMIRLNNSIQSDDYSAENPRVFFWYQVLTVGWESGARTRMRNFPTAKRVMEYLNKLHIGGYISDDDYTSAWDMALSIVRKCDDLNSVTYDTVKGPLSS